MAKSVLYRSMSLDGFITGPGNGLGNAATGGTSGSASPSPSIRTSTRRG